MTERLPALFVGHGSPMNAIEDTPYALAWAETGHILPQPEAILSVSAHWETNGTYITAMQKPRTIHDFGGFPRPLYEMQYPAPGSTELAQRVQKMIQSTRVQADMEWGLDHGTWSVLCRMFPAADIPVVQLSLDYSREADFHYALGRELRQLRREGVMIFGSGNMVHNLHRIDFNRKDGYDWAVEFDENLRQLIMAGDHAPIINYPQMGKAALQAIPTNEHFLPLLYILAQQEEAEQVNFFADGLTMGSISMRSLWFG